MKETQMDELRKRASEIAGHAEVARAAAQVAESAARGATKAAHPPHRVDLSAGAINIKRGEWRTTHQGISCEQVKAVDVLIASLRGTLDELVAEIESDEQMIARSKMEISYLRGKLRRQTNWEEYEKLIEGFHATLANVPKHLGGYK